jgi:4-hydroxybenzoate polyprenyltransferase
MVPVIDRKSNRPPFVGGLALSTHPGPAIAVTLVTVALGFGVGLSPLPLTLLGFAMLADQASVGFSNDWIDAGRDAAVGRSDKPIARGWVSVSAVRKAAIVAACLAIALTIPLGPLATLAHAVALGSAWSYNAWLKKTPASVLPFMVSFGLLPLIVTLAQPRPAFAAPWAIAAGALLGVAAHFSNVLPDFADDRATGIRGLPHLVGRKASGVVIAVALAAASGFIAFGPASAPGILNWVGLGVTTALAITAACLAIFSQPRRLLFQLIILGAIINVAMLALAGSQLSF